MMENIPIYLIFTPILAALIIYILHHKYTNYLIFLAQLILSILAVKYYLFIDKNPLLKNITLGGWDKRIGIELKNDTLSFTFIFLTIFIFTIISIYCFDKRKDDSKFLFFLLFLEGAFLALLQSNDLFNLFILIEITTIISTILIIFKKDGYAVKAGIYYLLFNSVGIIFYLLGIILLYNLFGTLNIDIIKENMDLVENQSLLHFSFILIMSSLGVKSALFPVFTWLPKAHGAAPSSISALLSGLIVKSGLYLFIKMNILFEITTFKDYFFIIGFISAIIGIIFALSQKDIKQILAYHTISQIGIILMGISTNHEMTYYGGLYHILNHAFFKSLLFLAVGMVIRTYNVRRVTEVRGVLRTMPFTSIFLIIGMLSITGAPLFNGYVSKSLLLYGFKDDTVKYLLFYLINIGTAASFVKLSQILFGKASVKSNAKLNEKIALTILSIACIGFGIYASYFTNLFFRYQTDVIIFDFLNLLIYLLILLIGFIIYRYIVDKDYEFFKIVRHYQISFETTNYLLILYIFSMFLWRIL